MGMRIRSLICLGLFILVFPLISGCGGGGGGGAPIPTPALDSDGDGIVNTVDACPDTRSGALVDDSGCSAVQLAGNLTASGGHTCAMTTTDGIKCWGWNLYGQLGAGIFNMHSSSVPVGVAGLASGVDAITGGGEHTCALTDTGGATCWGRNQFGQLGDNSTVDTIAPIDVTGLGSGVTAIAAGGYHTCVRTDTGGAACWGYNSYGQLGDGSNTDAHTAVAVSGLSSGADAVATTGNHTCALTDTGGVSCWGKNTHGQLGDNTTTDSNVPVAVSGLSGVVQVSGGSHHTCAMTGTGTVRCWGNNGWGQLGDNSTTNSSVPVAVDGLSGVTAISAGGYHTCALTSTGSVTCWGMGLYGQLGTGGTSNAHTPVDVTGLTGIVSTIAAGGYHTCTQTEDMGVACWGMNDGGRLGDGTTDDSLVPVDVVGLP